jgi:hypothetical protein
MGRQMFANGGQVRYMQAGGSPMMPPAPEQAVDPAAIPQMAMAGMPPPQVGSMGEAEGMGAQAGIDPAVLEQMLGQAAGQFEGIDAAAENEDYEGVINAIRGDQASLQDRRMELAEMVGDEDAQQTPDSVLTLVQPVMQMAAVDQGIGGLAPETMTTPIEGDMAGGIMSTINMGAEEAPVPVNFNQGGAVQYFAPENTNRVAGAPDPRALELFNQDRALYGQLIGGNEQQAAYDEQKKMTQAQMLFDIAQGALAFATPGDRQMSPAERLAQVAQPVLGNIGARSGELLKFKQGQAAEKRQLDMAALQSSQTKLGVEKQDAAAKEAASALAASKPISEDNIFTVTITDENGDQKSVNRALTQGQYSELVKKHGSANVSMKAFVKPGTPQRAENFMYNGSMVAAVPGTPLYARLTAPGSGAVVAGDMPFTAMSENTQYTLAKPVVLNNVQYAAGSSPYLSDTELSLIKQSYGNDAVTAYVAPVSDKDFFAKYGMDKDSFEDLSKENQAYLKGLPVITDAMYFTKYGFSKNDFLALDAATKLRLRGLEPEYDFRTVNNGKTIDVIRTDKNDPNAKGVSIYSNELLLEPDWMKVMMPNDKGVQTTTVIDLSTQSGKAALQKVNELNAQTPGSAILQKTGTESFVSKAFLVPNSAAGGGASVRMSFDNGQTYIGSDGLPRQLSPDAFELNNTQTYDVYKREKIRNQAKAWLANRDDTLANSLSFDGSLDPNVKSNPDGVKITPAERAEVKNTMAQIRAGTGPYSAIYAGINAVLGGLLAPEKFSEMFSETEEGRQAVKLIYVLGRSTLASNPRLAVADLNVTGELFPASKIFQNPVSEAKKLRKLVRAVYDEEIRIQQALGGDAPLDQAVTALYMTKLNEIARFKELVGPIELMSSGASKSSMEGADNMFKGKVINRGGK